MQGPLPIRCLSSVRISALRLPGLGTTWLLGCRRRVTAQQLAGSTLLLCRRSPGELIVYFLPSQSSLTTCSFAKVARRSPTARSADPGPSIRRPHAPGLQGLWAASTPVEPGLRSTPSPHPSLAVASSHSRLHPRLH